MSFVFTVRIKPDAENFGGFYIARNLLCREITLTKYLPDARIWGTYQEAEHWLNKYRATEPLGYGEVVELLELLRKW